MGSWVEDDVELGGPIEIGEALRGMQDYNYHMGAGRAGRLAHVRGLLGGFAQHAPITKRLRSPYKDSTQIGILCQGTFTPAAWAGTTLPQINGVTRVYKSFKPSKAIVTELVIATYTASGQTAQTVVAAVTNAADLVLVSAFSGADNCFPNAPIESTGISGPTFANVSYGNGISWPTIQSGNDMTVAFAIESTAQFQTAAPAGFTLSSVFVKVRFNLLGPSLR